MAAAALSEGQDEFDYVSFGGDPFIEVEEHDLRSKPDN